MINTKVLKFSKRIAIILLIAAFSIAGIVACSGDDITGSGGRNYSSENTNPGGSSGSDDFSGGNGSSGGDDSSGGNGGSGDGGSSGGDTDSGDDTTILPNDSPADYYNIRVPFGVGGDGYTNVSYKDTNKLKQLWFDQINRKAANDGKVFAIRNKGNNRDANNFQRKHTHGQYSAQDYYYFNENGDIVYKEDNRIIKKFVGAIITGYRDIEKRNFGRGWPGKPSNFAIVEYKWKQKGIFTVGAIYANTLTTDEARKIYFGRQKTGGAEDFESGDNPFKDGVYDFVAYRYRNETYNDGINFAANLFERQYINPGFIEVLVMYPYDNMGYSGAAGLHSYYAYHGIYDMWEEYVNHPGIYFTPQNMPYMTNQNLYLGKKPEDTIPLLTHSAAFTDNPRGWCYLFMPGQKDISETRRVVRINNGMIR